jgi:hypothetical protein
MNDDELKLPLTSAPTDQHAQVMYALGQITGEMRALKEAKLIQNGRVDKLEGRMAGVEKQQNMSDGASITWGKILSFAAVIIAAIALIVKFIK